MTADATAVLAEQRRQLRAQLAAQRLRLAGLFASDDAGYPRSVTMRWLIREPELVTKLLERVVGRKLAGAAPTVLLLARFLRTAAA